MKKSEFKEIINTSIEKTWEVLFNQYGDIHVHNPTMPTSKYLNNATKGGLNCTRYVTFDDKLFLEETITEVDEHKSFKVEAYKHNLPFLKEMSAIYELTSLGADKTEVTMNSFVSTSPGFMIYLMKGQLGNGLKKHLFGLKYYLETGQVVDKDNYTDIFKNYK
ncbi:SRPBCC family protein [Urechidicola vernalis]|uniref:SRPBCC family protein n=1 Tax=Urechidicola vernalis TaxID=3075600 RepID=A0ABU2Y8G0_9FLAO|nr:SRPBCC family protein [Urechidicola sp. P050]MDT0553934.1 SRPBCC family protein [Urechidicola sp. P050]